MKILLIMPDAGIHKLKVGRFVRSLREAPLTLTTLAALAPEEMEIEFSLIDESVDSLPPDARADLVGISLLTGTAPRGYAMADRFRRRGVPVVLGGVHATILPDEAARHADSVAIGPAEETWPRLLRDFAAGDLRAQYRGGPPRGGVLSGLPAPRRDLQRRGGYMVPNTVMATRGCRHACEFCSVPAAMPGFAARPVADVIRDIRSSSGRFFAFNDVNLLDDREYARELFTAMVPLKKKWGGLATTQVGQDPAMVDLMARSGCIYLLLGFESVLQPALDGIQKGFNRPDRYRATMALLHGHGISVQGCFVFGFDHDDRSVFDRTVETVNELKIDIPRYALYTPYPGTRLFGRLQREGRILSTDWADYDTQHVVFQPARMTPQELYDGFRSAYRKTFTLAHIARRTLAPSFRFPVNFVGNLAYRLYARRLAGMRGCPPAVVKEAQSCHA